MKENYETHNIFERLKELCIEIKGRTNLTRHKKMKYEALDRDIYRSCLNAEKESKKINNGKYWWSPKLDQAGMILQYWQRRKKDVGNMQETGSLMIESGKLGIKDSITYTKQEIEDLIRDSSDKLRSIQMLDKEFRVQHLLEIAEIYASDNDISRETATRDLLYHEELRDTFRK